MKTIFKGEMVMKKLNEKHLVMGAALLGSALSITATLLTNWSDDKLLDQRIQEAVAEALKKASETK